MSKRFIVTCPRCGSVYFGDSNYEKVDFCKCGQWLEWDKHSRLDRPIPQAASTINPKHYRSGDWENGRVGVNGK